MTICRIPLPGILRLADVGPITLAVYVPMTRVRLLLTTASFDRYRFLLLILQLFADFHLGSGYSISPHLRDCGTC